MISTSQRVGLISAGPVFAAGLALMQPQMTAYAELEGRSAFLRSIAAEPAAWQNGHIALLAAAGLYLLAGLAAGEVVARRQAWTGLAIKGLFLVGTLALIGNFTLDFVYAALATGLDIKTAQAARSALLANPVVQMPFAQIGPGFFVLGMGALALCAIATGWAPRLAGVLILAGWAVVLGLNGQFPYAEALGHFIIGTGFWVIGWASRQTGAPEAA